MDYQPPREYRWNYQQLVQNAKRHNKPRSYRTRAACMRAIGRRALYGALIEEFGPTMQADPSITVQTAMAATGHTAASILKLSIEWHRKQWEPLVKHLAAQSSL